MAVMQVAEHLYAHAIRQDSGLTPAERRRAMRSREVRQLIPVSRRGLALPLLPPSIFPFFLADEGQSKSRGGGAKTCRNTLTSPPCRRPFICHLTLRKHQCSARISFDSVLIIFRSNDRSSSSRGQVAANVSTGKKE